MGLTCNYERRKIGDIGKKRGSKRSLSCNVNYNFPPKDDDDDEKTDSKKDNFKIQKSKNNNSPTSNSRNNNIQTKNKKNNNRNNNRKNTANITYKEIPKKNSYNDDDNNNKNKDNDDGNINDNDNTIKSYSKFNNKSKYYIVCPDCKNKVPSIKDTGYDANRNDFIIGYFCGCNSNGDDKKTYLINFISDIEPENVAYSFESLEILKLMLDTVRNKQDEFQGFKILDKIYKELNKLKKTKSYNKSMAPPANMYKSLVENKNN
jgi:hypothetical protein